MPRVYLKHDADRRLRAGHLWIFANELRPGFQDIAPGSFALVVDNTGRTIGVATINPHSLIAGRLFTSSPQIPDRDFFLQRLRSAIHLRERIFGGLPAGCRIVFGESDGLPGLVVDLFGETLVVQSLSAGMESLLPVVSSCLAELLQPQSIVYANDSAVRSLEGLTLYRTVHHGQLDEPILFEINNIINIADPLNGQKTGFFLDQQANRTLSEQFVRQDMRVLDLFCYSGGFGLHALRAGAQHVQFVDSSAHALALTRQAVSANGWADRSSYINADIFEMIKNEAGKFDMVFLDPPAMAKSRAKVPSALRGYRDLNARAMNWIKPGGLLATSSCSGLISGLDWRHALASAALKAGRKLRILATGGQAPDHLILSSMPETEYLKFLIAVVD